MKILIDNGHGSNTLGKRSPDGVLREYAYTREIARRLVSKLKETGYDAELVTPEDTDISITTRVKRINRYCRTFGNSNCLVISIHNDAAGSKGQWLAARGWSARVSLNASPNSKKLATCLANAAEKNGLRVRRQRTNQDWWPQNLGICRDTLCPAVLTENLFMDNKEDYTFLLSEKGKETIVKSHFDGICDYIKSH